MKERLREREAEAFRSKFTDKETAKNTSTSLFLFIMGHDYKQRGAG